MTKYKSYVLSILAGIIYASGYPNIFSYTLIITPILGLLILFHFILKAKNLKERVLHLLCFNFAFNMAGFYWITSTLQEFGELPFILAGLISSLFTLVITPHLWFAIFLIHFLFGKAHLDQEKAMEPGIHSLLLAIVLTTIEYFIPQQFDLMLGQPWIIIGEYLGFASIFGLPIYSFFSYLLLFEALSLFHKKGFSKLNIAMIALFIIANPIVANQMREEADDIKKLNIRMVQANISNFLKTDSEKGTYSSVSEVIARYKELSLEPHEFTGGIDLIIWPETAFPYSIATNKGDLAGSYLPQVFREIIEHTQSEMFVGGYDHYRSNGKSYFKTEFNTNFHFAKNQTIKDVYHKHILIPFGETLPFGPFNEYLSKYIENISFFKEGTEFPLFKLKTGHTFINTICYEALKPEFVRTYLNSVTARPHAIINLTNDSWYGDTMEPEQHLFLQRWRALEFNLPIIRSTNTGISVVVSPYGADVKRLKLGQTGNLDVSLKMGLNKTTIFQKFGFMSIIALWILYLVFHIILLKLEHKSYKDEF